jgi:hypothetical protein
MRRQILHPGMTMRHVSAQALPRLMMAITLRVRCDARSGRTEPPIFMQARWPLIFKPRVINKLDQLCRADRVHGGMVGCKGR